MTPAEQIRQQFIEFIKGQAFDDQYIDRQEEKRIVEVGIKNEISVEESLSLIQQVVTEKGWVLEREAEDRVKDTLETFASDGKVDKKEFEDALAIFKKLTKGTIPEPELKRKIKNIMEINGWQAKEGGLFGSKWYSAIQ